MYLKVCFQKWNPHVSWVLLEHDSIQNYLYSCVLCCQGSVWEANSLQISLRQCVFRNRFPIAWLGIAKVSGEKESS